MHFSKELFEVHIQNCEKQDPETPALHILGKNVIAAGI
jgi:hypothetical protein